MGYCAHVLRPLRGLAPNTSLRNPLQLGPLVHCRIANAELGIFVTKAE
jgi:hypothetical protein